MHIPLHLNQAYVITTKGIICRPKWRKQIGVYAVNWNPKKAKKLPNSSTNQMSFRMCGDHDCFTKSILYAEHKDGRGIAGATSLTISQQVSFLSLFWAYTNSVILTLNTHPNHSISFPINRVPFSLQEKLESHWIPAKITLHLPQKQSIRLECLNHFQHNKNIPTPSVNLLEANRINRSD